MVGGCLRSDCRTAPENLSQAAVKAKCMQFDPIAKDSCPIVDCETHQVMFATHTTLGVLDTGATKTVIGSDFVSELLGNLTAEARHQVRQCKCSIVFRFGNQGTLESSQALVIPVGNLMLKVAIVPGKTPFLISNTLVRTLKASIDAENDVLRSRLLSCEMPLKVTPKGLYLIDINDLIKAGQKTSRIRPDVTSTFVSETLEKDQPSIEKNPTVSRVRELIHCWENNPSLRSSPSKMHMSKPDQSLVTEKRVKFEPKVPTEVLKDPSISKCVDRRSGIPDDVACQSIGEDSESESSPDRRSRSQCLEARGSPGDDGRLRQHAYGKDIPDGMGTGTGMGPVDDSTLCQESKDVPPPLPQVRGADDHRMRESSRASSSDTKESNQSDGQESHSHPTSGKEAGSFPKAEAWQSLFQGPRSRTGMGGDRRNAGGIGWRDVELGDYGRSRECSPSGPSGVTNAEPRECAHQGDSTPRSDGASPGKLGTSETVTEEEAFLGTEMNGERRRLSKLVQQFEHEFECFQKEHCRNFRKRIALLEVFCSKDSPLTHQVRSLGGQSIRHGLAEGDLQTLEGRRALFEVLNLYEPENIWVSPECGPWSSWMSLNACKSVEHWDRCQTERWQMLDQVALCIMLFRVQKIRGRQFHWEQPAKSIMFNLPYLHEVHEASMIAQCDLCTIGDLKDPVSMKPMKKGLWILTTSKGMFEAIHGRTCNHEHEHEPIAGSTRINGKVVSKTQFTARYPRKFARLIAKVCMERKSRRILAEVFAGESESRSSAAIRVTSSQLPGRRFGKTPVASRADPS